eukprot:scaffold227321_cov17-Prasinocladus_malaysianus.AAC.1
MSIYDYINFDDKEVRSLPVIKKFLFLPDLSGRFPGRVGCPREMWRSFKGTKSNNAIVHPTAPDGLEKSRYHREP